MAAGPNAVNGTAVLGKVVLPAVISPLLAGLVAVTATFLAYRITAPFEVQATRLSSGIEKGGGVGGARVPHPPMGVGAPPPPGTNNK